VTPDLFEHTKIYFGCGRPHTMMNIEDSLTDFASPFKNGCFDETTKEAVNTAKQYTVMTLKDIFLAAIFILSAFPSALLSRESSALAEHIQTNWRFRICQGLRSYEKSDLDEPAVVAAKVSIPV